MRDLPTPTSLDDLLYSELGKLAEVRCDLDGVIVRFVSGLTDEALASTLSYSNTKGVESTKGFGSLLLHLFNHQTHHRGQVSTLLSQSGVDIGVTDLLMEMKNESTG